MVGLRSKKVKSKFQILMEKLNSLTVNLKEVDRVYLKFSDDMALTVPVSVLKKIIQEYKEKKWKRCESSTLLS